jgi:isopentenyl diphosphate isomerase/L-lactate dehydrogenase-like FMN-dependent dehydrogenase
MWARGAIATNFADVARVFLRRKSRRDLLIMNTAAHDAMAVFRLHAQWDASAEELRDRRFRGCRNQAAVMSRQMDASFKWEGFSWLRKLWLRQAVGEGHPAARRRRTLHRGRRRWGAGCQLDSAVSPLGVLADGRARISAPILIDGGYRRRTNIVKALALGANAVRSGEQASMALQRLVGPASTTSFTCSRKKSTDR